MGGRRENPAAARTLIIVCCGERDGASLIGAQRVSLAQVFAGGSTAGRRLRDATSSHPAVSACRVGSIPR